MNKKILIVTIILIAGITIGAIYLHNQNIKGETVTDATKWKEYSNQPNGYKIGYPENLVMSVQDTDLISFAESTNDPWIISIRVSTTTIKTASLWIREQDAKYGSETVVDDTITIDTLDALITYHRNGGESFPNEKTAIVVKEDKVFQIATRNINHRKVWGTFHFTK